MRQHFSNLGKQTLVYGLSAATLQAVGLVTLPVFTRTFTPAEYGSLEIAVVALSAMLLVADLGLASASQRSYFDYTDDRRAERRAVLATAVSTAVGAGLMIAAVLFAFRAPIADWLFEGRSYASLVGLVAVAIPASILAGLLREVMRLNFQAWHYAISASLSAIVTGLGGVGLVLWADAGLDGVLIGVLAGNLVGVTYGLVVAGRQIVGRLSRPELRTMLAYGLPLVPAAAALWGLSFVDRVMLSRLGSLDEVGQYAVGARFSVVVMLAVTAFSLAFSPFILSIWSSDKDLEKQVRARTLTYLTVVLMSLSLSLALFAREAITIIAPAFDTAHEVVGVLCFGVTLFGVSSVTMSGISYMRRTRLFAVYSLGAAALNVVLNFVLIPPLGGIGAGIATATAYALLAVGYYIKSQSLYPTPYEPRKTVAVLAAGAALMPLAFLPAGLEFVVVKLGGLVAFGVALLLLGVFDPPEIAELRTVIRRFARRPPEASPSQTAGGG